MSTLGVKELRAVLYRLINENTGLNHLLSLTAAQLKARSLYPKSFRYGLNKDSLKCIYKI